ncbi:MAG: hypothetical protein HXY24_05850 [Rubrivivax sp.]|nr:hypothetical protein [Rubrivivax sp.]
MVDSPHASHWQQAAAAGEAFAVTVAIAAAVFLLFDRASRVPLAASVVTGVAAVVPCDDGLPAGVRHACLNAVAGGTPAVAATRVDGTIAAPRPATGAP